MASNIDPTQPPASNPTTAAMRANMAAAKAEIEELQTGKANIATAAGITKLTGAKVNATDAYLGADYLALVFKDMSITVPNAAATFIGADTGGVASVLDLHGILNPTTGQFTIPSGITGMSMAINIDWSDPAAATETVRHVLCEIEVSPANWFPFGFPGYTVNNVVGWETHQHFFICDFEAVASNIGKKVRLALYQNSGASISSVHAHTAVWFRR